MLPADYIGNPSLDNKHSNLSLFYENRANGKIIYHELNLAYHQIDLDALEINNRFVTVVNVNTLKE